MQGPQAHWLADGRRLHLNHGPIDLIIEAFGDAAKVHQAYEQAVARFQTILEELVSELPDLRRPATPSRVRRFVSPTARRMEAAVSPLATDFLTPMAAVAGSVADEMLQALVSGCGMRRAYVNNGGDCALHIDAGEDLSIAVAGTGQPQSGRLTISGESVVRGVATSGRRGRSFSLGIADAVTVLARTGAAADAAATVIANAVDLQGHKGIVRRPASELQPDSDLGDRAVTIAVDGLSSDEIDAALEAGLATALALQHRGLIEGAALFLAGHARTSVNEGILFAPYGPRGVAAHDISL